MTYANRIRKDNSVLVVGSSAIDSIFERPKWPADGERQLISKLYPRSGGNAINQAMVLAALLGGDSETGPSKGVRLFTPIGEGGNGTFLHAQLTRCGLRFPDSCRFPRGSTPVSLIRRTASSGECSIIHAMNANAIISKKEILKNHSTAELASDFLVISGIGLCEALESSLPSLIDELEPIHPPIVLTDTNLLEDIGAPFVKRTRTLLAKTHVFLPNFAEAVQLLRAATGDTSEWVKASDKSVHELGLRINDVFQVRIATIIKRDKFGASIVMARSTPGVNADTPSVAPPFNYEKCRSRLLSRRTLKDELDGQVCSLGCGDSWCGAFVAYLSVENLYHKLRLVVDPSQLTRSATPREIDDQLTQAGSYLAEHLLEASVFGNAAAVHCLNALGSTDWIHRNCDHTIPTRDLVRYDELRSWTERQRLSNPTKAKRT